MSKVVVCKQTKLGLYLAPFLLYLATFVFYVNDAKCENSSGGAVENFEFASPKRPLNFPRDHGTHMNFQTEWWYLTGHLVADGESIFGQKTLYGVQLTFFRRKVADGSWGQVYLAHGALSDIANRRFSHDVRYGRSGMGVASASESNLNIALFDWGLESVGSQWLLRWNVGKKTQVRLVTESIKDQKVMKQGDEGFSKKGSCDTCASIYYSIPQISVSGEVRHEGTPVKVSGLLWMDHEFMTNALQPDQVGWDWFSLMEKGGRSIMLFRVRGRSRDDDFFSASIFDGRVTKKLNRDDFSITEMSYWISPKTSSKYPHGWRIRIPSLAFDESLNPLLSDQEIVTEDGKGVSYWEGAISNGSGDVKGYAELVGYGGGVPGL